MVDWTYLRARGCAPVCLGKLSQVTALHNWSSCTTCTSISNSLGRRKPECVPGDWWSTHPSIHLPQPFVAAQHTALSQAQTVDLLQVSSCLQIDRSHVSARWAFTRSAVKSAAWYADPLRTVCIYDRSARSRSVAIDRTARSAQATTPTPLIAGSAIVRTASTDGSWLLFSQKDRCETVRGLLSPSFALFRLLARHFPHVDRNGGRWTAPSCRFAHRCGPCRSAALQCSLRTSSRTS